MNRLCVYIVHTQLRRTDLTREYKQKKVMMFSFVITVAADNIHASACMSIAHYILRIKSIAKTINFKSVLLRS